MIELIVGIVAAYGVAFTIVLKLENFIVKREDYRISELIEDFHQSVIKADIKSIREEKSTKRDTLEDLRNHLNLPNRTDFHRKQSSKSGKWSVLGLVSTALIFIIALVLPLYALPILAFGFYVVIFAIAGIIHYYKSLGELRTCIDKMEKLIQDSRILL